MPVFKDVEVHVTTADGVKLQEYGTQKLNRANLASCYIQSETDMPFRITVQPTTTPFPAMKDDPETERLASLHHRKAEHDEVACYVARWGEPPECGKYSCESHSQAPWHLVATLHLDGRAEHERHSVVFLDQDHDYVVPPGDPGNKVIIKHRRFEAADGSIRQAGWSFKEVGIDTLMELMEVKPDEDEVSPGNGVTGLDEDLSSALENVKGDLADAESQSVGQIEIILRRAVLYNYQTEVAWHEDPQANTSSVYDGKDVSKASHTAQRGEGQVISPRARVRSFYFLDGQAKPYATFKFYYRSEAVLRKFGFLGAKANATPEKHGQGYNKRRRDFAFQQSMVSIAGHTRCASAGSSDSPQSDPPEDPGEGPSRGRKRIRPEPYKRRDSSSSISSSSSTKSMHKHLSEDAEDESAAEKKNATHSDSLPNLVARALTPVRSESGIVGELKEHITTKSEEQITIKSDGTSAEDEEEL